MLHEIITNYNSNGISTFTFKDLLIIIREIATIAGIIFGIYAGNKGIRKYLINDIVKLRFRDICETNRKIFLLTKNIISDISSKISSPRPVTEDDLKNIIKITKNLSEEANGSSTEIHSLSEFLYETVKDIPTMIKTKHHFERYMANEFYNLIYSTCSRINYFANNIVDIPNSTKIELFSEIRTDLKKYLKSKGIKKIKGFHVGLDLSVNSSISVIFSEMINQSTDSYIFKKRYFQLLNNNLPILYELLASKIYCPPIIRNNDTSIFGKKYELYLVKIKFMRTIGKKVENTVDLIYSNINNVVHFVQSLKEEDIKKDYYDGFSHKKYDFWKDVRSISKLGEESIKVTVSQSGVEKLFKSHKKEIIRELKKYQK